jgi:hypothetical protein
MWVWLSHQDGKIIFRWHHMLWLSVHYTSNQNQQSNCLLAVNRRFYGWECGHSDTLATPISRTWSNSFMFMINVVILFLVTQKRWFQIFYPSFTGYKNSSSFWVVCNSIQNFGCCILTIFLRPERSIIPSTDPFAGFTTAIASFAKHLHRICL